MKLPKTISVIKFFAGTTVFLAVVAALPFVLYLKVLPWAVSNPDVINYAEKIVKDAYSVDISIEKPYLVTGLNPDVKFGVGSFYLSTQKNNNILTVKNFDTDISLKELFNKKIIRINRVSAENITADVNKILKLPFLNSKTESQSEYTVDIFHSVLMVKNADIIYDIGKRNSLRLNAKDFRLTGGKEDKLVSYKISAALKNGKNIINIKTGDNNNVHLKNCEKIIFDNSEIYVSQNSNKPSLILMKGVLDSKYNYSVNLKSKNFEVPKVLDFLNTQVIENNISQQLVYFKNIAGKFDFDVNADNKAMNGTVKLHELKFNLVPLLDMPVKLTDGDVKFDNYKVVLKNFKGYYNNNQTNKMDFEGTVKDYLKSVDTNLTGNAIVMNDFAQNYFSKMINYPVKIKGKADTRVVLKSKNNKIDLTWLYMFKKGNGFVVDGEESLMNDGANRVLAAKMHFENMLLNLKSIDYYADRSEGNKREKPVQIVSMNGNIDFSDGKTFVKDFGFSLPNPMPSGFINMLMKQRFFKNGKFSGDMRVINTGKYPVLEGSMKADKVAIPSLRLFIKDGEFSAAGNRINISSTGRNNRSNYILSGAIVNEIKFPVVVKNITLNLDDIDVEKYLQFFNEQQPTEAAADVQTEIAKSVEKGGDNENSDEAAAFDLANLIVEEGILNISKGHYKGINFSDVAATMSLDKNSFLRITSNKFNIAEGGSTGKIDCDLKNHKYSIKLGIKDVNSDIIATNLLNLSKEINGKASGLIDLNTDDSLKLNGKMKFKVDNGVIGKVGLIEYVMKVAAIFRNPVTMVSPTIISDLVEIPEGRFDKIDGELKIKDNVVYPLMIKTQAPQLSSFIIGTYNLENQDAALRIYTKFSNKRKGVMGVLRNISLNALSNRIPLSGNNDLNYYSAELSQLPDIDADEKDCQIFLTKVDGDIEHNNFLSSLKKLK